MMNSDLDGKEYYIARRRADLLEGQPSLRDLVSVSRLPTAKAVGYSRDAPTGLGPKGHQDCAGRESCAL